MADVFLLSLLLSTQSDFLLTIFYAIDEIQPVVLIYGLSKFRVEPDLLNPTNYLLLYHAG